MFNNLRNLFGQRGAAGGNSPRNFQDLFRQMGSGMGQPNSPAQNPAPATQPPVPAARGFLGGLSPSVLAPNGAPGASSAPGPTMQGPSQPTSPYQQLEQLSNTLRGTPTGGAPGSPGFPAFDPNRPQVQRPPGGFGVPPGYPGSPGFPANSGYPTMQGYPMPRPPQALIDAERAMQSTPEYQALTAYHRSISTGQGLTQDQEQELQKLNNAFQQTDAFKKRAEMAGGQVGNALRNGIPGNPGFPANSGYPTMQGYPGVPFSGTSGTPGTFASEPMRGSPGMFGGGPMGMGPMVGGVPSQIGGQDIRNLIGGQPQQPQPPAGLSAALQQANPAMSGLSNVFGRGMFKDGGAVKARAKKKGV